MKIPVFVKPGSKKGDLVEVVSDGLIVFLRAKAVDGGRGQKLRYDRGRAEVAP